MLSLRTAIEVVSSSSGLPAHEVAAACEELASNNLVFGNDEDWDARDLSILFLRLTANHVHIDRFDDEIANCCFSGSVLNGETNEAVLSRRFCWETPASILDQHLSCLESGAQGTSVYDIDEVTVSGTEAGYSVCVFTSWHDTGGEPDSNNYLFGEADLRNTGRMTSIPALTLTALGEALRQSRQYENRFSADLRNPESLLVPGNRLVH